MMVEPGNILKLFLNFGNFEPQYSYRLYSYKKKSVAYVPYHRVLCLAPFAFVVTFNLQFMC